VFEIEIGSQRQRVGVGAVEFHEKIDIAAFGIEVSASRGAEKVEPAHMVAPAQGVQFFAMAQELIDHLGFRPEAAV
jgi:hypothetical protein